jgi:hypothetical protein
LSEELGAYRGPSYRVNRNQGLDPMTRRLMLIAAGLTGALVVIVLLWSSMGRRSNEVPVVQADARPLRIKPDNPGGMQITGINADISGQADGPGGTLAPAPEVPDPQALAHQAPPTPKHALQATSIVTPPPAPPVREAPPEAAATPTAAPQRHPMPAQGSSPSPPGRREVQLAALSSEAAAREEWDRLVQRMPGLFASRQPIVTRFDHDRHLLWRLRVGGFATEAAAGQFCQEVRAKGGGCSVAAF